MDLYAEIKGLKAERDEARQENAELGHMLHAANENFEAAIRQRDAAIKQREEAAEDHEKAFLERDAAREERDRSYVQVGELKGQINKLNQELADAQKALGFVNQTYTDQLAERDRTIRALSAGFEAWLQIHTEQRRG